MPMEYFIIQEERKFGTVIYNIQRVNSPRIAKENNPSNLTQDSKVNGKK